MWFKTAQNCPKSPKIARKRLEIASKLLGGVKAAASHENWEPPGPIFQYLLGSGSAHPPIYFQYLLGFSAIVQYNTCREAKQSFGQALPAQHAYASQINLVGTLDMLARCSTKTMPVLVMIPNQRRTRSNRRS